MQEETTDRQGRLHPPRCTPARDDRCIVCMAVMERAAPSRTIAQQNQSVVSIILCPLVPFDAVCSRVECHQTSIALFTFDWNAQWLYHQWCDERLTGTTE
ncbi:hypothetical protein TNCV_3869821 [Trichonephila clavipes]|nr:hypothetical protein TNCV_3869821 [Trichonephila clavipes]